jgi:hypothetical protein
MDLQRREFLHLFGELLAGLALAPSPAVFCRDDLYLNRRLGVAFTRPPGWEYMRVAQMGEMQKGQILDLPETTAQYVLDRMDLPVVAMTYSVGEGHEPSLGIQWWRAELEPPPDPAEELLRQHFPQRAPERERTFPPALRIIRRDWGQSRTFLREFRCSSLPTETVVSGYPAAQYTAHYWHQHEDLPESLRVVTRTIAIHHGPLFHLIRLHDAAGGNADFNPFLASIALA